VHSASGEEVGWWRAADRRVVFTNTGGSFEAPANSPAASAGSPSERIVFGKRSAPSLASRSCQPFLATKQYPAGVFWV
jgi:hypothetical protein